MPTYAHLRAAGDYTRGGTVSTGEDHELSPPGQAALAWARRGYPVFPLHNPDPEGTCSCGGQPGCNPCKHPRFHPKDLRNGHTDATTDPGQIRRWWSLWPDANIGTPTGEDKGRFGIDYDRDKGDGRDGLASREALEAEHGKLPTKLKVSTPSGGLHDHLNLPSGERIRSGTDRLGPGVDIRADGGYVVMSPSRTAEGRYEVLEVNPHAGEPPESLLEALREPHGCDSEGSAKSRELVGQGPDLARGPEIPEGRRNDTLTSIAGKLRARGMEPREMADELERINAARCAPPLPVREARYIGIMGGKRWPKGNASPEPDPETLELLGRYAAALEEASWPEMRGKSDRDVLISLILAGRKHGKRIPAGVRVSIGLRPLALIARVSLPTLQKSVKRLREAGWLCRDDYGRSPGMAGAFVLLEDRAKVTHSTSGGRGYRTSQ